MKQFPKLLLFSVIFGLICNVMAYAQEPGQPSPEKKYEDFSKVIAKAQTYEGLFKLHLKEDHLYAEIRPDQLNKPFLAPIAIARGAGLGGYTLNFDEQWILIFKRVGDNVQLIRRNVHFKAENNSPVSRAVETTYTDSILLSIPIRTINHLNNSVVIDFNSIFMKDFAELNLGNFDPSRSSWSKIKAFPHNIELQISATFTGRNAFSFRNDSVIDSRGTTVVIHYSLLELPDNSYHPRLADDRIGYFLTAVKDFSHDDRDTSFVRYINRWRLERVDNSVWKPGAKLVPPKKKIIFWIEKSVPDEYRSAVREGILEWNKAFEKVGFRDAIEVRQQENEDFDPEDCNYNTFRWITTDQGFAMGPSRANPFTGEIFDADIIFDASMIRFYKIQRQIFQQNSYSQLKTGSQSQQPESTLSLIEATRKGWLLPSDPLSLRRLASWNDRNSSDFSGITNGNPLLTGNVETARRLLAIRQGMCQCASNKSSELEMALIAVAARANLKEGEKLSDEMIQQAIKETVMHEVGHTLGLRHNFKASTMLNNNELHDLNITRKRGLVGSVMDYNPVNLAPKGTKQGDYFTTTIGPYDYWAIEYGYKPLTGGTDGETNELKKIASRCAEPGLDYGTDEDLMTNDPNVNVWDMGADPLRYAQDRILIAEELLKGLADRVVEKGEGYQRARSAFGLVLRQFADGAFLASQFIGGEYNHRDHRGDEHGREPMIPVTGEKQKECLKFLQTHILTDQPFQFSPELLRKLAADRWLHWGSEENYMSGTEYPLNNRILSIQRIVLRNLLSSATLTRIQDNAAKKEGNDSPLKVEDVFRTLTDSIFVDAPLTKTGNAPASSIIRRNLQREYVSRLSEILLRGSPADARSLSRMHLKELNQRISLRLAPENKNTKSKQIELDDTSRAHFLEISEMIQKVLAANIQLTQP